MDGAIRQQITMLNSRFGLILIYGLRHNAKPTAFDMSFSVLAQSRSAPSCGQIWYEEREVLVEGKREARCSWLVS